LSTTNIAINAIINAGIQILKIYDNPLADFSIEKKEDHSPLTIADKASHIELVKFLKETNIPILSEEGLEIPYSERKKWDLFWLIDPLDGTKEFIKRNGEFTVNIALVENGIPILGLIYVPVTKTLYIGDTNRGAWKIESIDKYMSFDEIMLKGKKLPQPLNEDLFTVVASRSHMSLETENYINTLKESHSEIHFLTVGSSLKICMVAEGIANEYPRFGPTMEWDTAAGHAIANASGKKLWLSTYERELKYNKEDLLNPYFIVK
jgi:3'(2'), 5'-bisphosphate nucleotidase